MHRYLSVASAAPLLLVSGSAFAAASTSAFISTAPFDPTGWFVAALAILAAGFVVAPRYARGFFVLACVVVATSLMLDVAYAADASAPETVAQATSDTTKVTWAYGATIAQWADAISALIFAFVAWLLRKLPSQIYSVIVSMRADQLIQKGIDYAINMVKDATKDKALSVDVHNAVLAQALQYVIDHSPDWLISWMGGPEQIAQKIIARLNLAPDAVPDVAAAVAATSQPAA